MGLGEIVKLIYELQSVTGKILRGKELGEVKIPTLSRKTRQGWGTPHPTRFVALFYYFS